MNNQSVKNARNEVFRKIGRNVVNFQMMERVLKELEMTSGFHGKASEFMDQLKKRNESAEMQSMGILARKFLDSIVNNSAETEPVDDLDESWISMNHTIEIKEQDAKSLKRAINEIVKERNKLIHQQLVEVDFNSIEKCNELSAQLDLQREKVKPQFEILLSFLKGRIESRKQMAEIMSTKEYQDWFLGK